MQPTAPGRSENALSILACLGADLDPDDLTERMFELDGESRTTLKLNKPHHRLNTRGHYFTQRVINLWNSLKEESVSVPSMNEFKNRLDLEWQDKEWKFNRNAAVT